MRLQSWPKKGLNKGLPPEGPGPSSASRAAGERGACVRGVRGGFSAPPRCRPQQRSSNRFWRRFIPIGRPAKIMNRARGWTNKVKDARAARRRKKGRKSLRYTPFGPAFARAAAVPGRSSRVLLAVRIAAALSCCSPPDLQPVRAAPAESAPPARGRDCDDAFPVAVLQGTD